MKYRKMPVVIDAWEFDGNYNSLNEAITLGANIVKSHDDGGYYAVKTLEGMMRINVGDYVIRGVKNEFYPCKPDIFAATYDPA